MANILGSLSAPLKGPNAKLADGGPFAGKEFYEGDIAALTEEQRNRLIERMAQKFNLPLDEVKKDLESIGFPILVNNVTVSWCEKHRNLDIAGYDEYDSDWNQDYDEDDDLEQGEINLFSSMPWINDNIGSMMEAQLCRYKDSDQCRNCGKHGESLRNKEAQNRFCSEKCHSEWTLLLETRIAQGKHDLRTRGFD